VIQADFGQQPGEAGPAFGAGAALTLVLVDHQDPIGRPTPFDRT